MSLRRSVVLYYGQIWRIYTVPRAVYVTPIHYGVRMFVTKVDMVKLRIRRRLAMLYV